MLFLMVFSRPPFACPTELVCVFYTPPISFFLFPPQFSLKEVVFMTLFRFFRLLLSRPSMTPVRDHVLRSSFSDRSTRVYFFPLAFIFPPPTPQFPQGQQVFKASTPVTLVLAVHSLLSPVNMRRIGLSCFWPFFAFFLPALSKAFKMLCFLPFPLPQPIYRIYLLRAILSSRSHHLRTNCSV